jgi:hypothetical protein
VATAAAKSGGTSWTKIGLAFGAGALAVMVVPKLIGLIGGGGEAAAQVCEKWVNY